MTLPYSGPPLNLNRLLGVLARHEVDFVVVGGSAVGSLGAARLTEDADCVVRRERANLDRLAEALRELHARLRVARMNDEVNDRARKRFRRSRRREDHRRSR